MENTGDTEGGKTTEAEADTEETDMIKTTKKEMEKQDMYHCPKVVALVQA